MHRTEQRRTVSNLATGTVCVCDPTIEPAQARQADERAYAMQLRTRSYTPKRYHPAIPTPPCRRYARQSGQNLSTDVSVFECRNLQSNPSQQRSSALSFGS
jgi:hypothetical protein